MLAEAAAGAAGGAGPGQRFEFDFELAVKARHGGEQPFALSGIKGGDCG